MVAWMNICKEEEDCKRWKEMNRLLKGMVISFEGVRGVLVVCSGSILCVKAEM